MAAISWIIFSHDAFVSQETFANELCSGILAAKSEMNLDMRWDYLGVTVRTSNNLERVGWGQSQNPQLEIVSSSLNWINVFRSLLFCHALLQPIPLSKISLAEMTILTNISPFLKAKSVRQSWRFWWHLASYNNASYLIRDHPDMLANLTILAILIQIASSEKGLTCQRICLTTKTIQRLVFHASYPNYLNSFIETSISESHNLTQIRNSNVVFIVWNFFLCPFNAASYTKRRGLHVLRIKQFYNDA